jgi:hypothetical protein
MNALRQGEAESEREAGRKMVKVSVEVRSDTACLRIGVQAESIRRALAMVGRSYPRGKISVVFPIEPEDFFVSVPSSPADLVRFERTQREAA